MEGRKFRGGCGVAVAARIAGIFGYSIPQEQIKNEIGFSEELGVQPENLEKWVRQRLLMNALWVDNMTIEALWEKVKSGAVVVIDWKNGEDPWEDGHYSILKRVFEKDGELLMTLDDPDLMGMEKTFKVKEFVGDEKHTYWEDIHPQTGQRLYQRALIVNY